MSAPFTKDDYGEKILSILLDWYENSPAWSQNRAPAKRRIMRLYDGGRTDFPLYDIENRTVRTGVNNAVMDMADRGFIGYEWMRGQKDHIIAKTWLIMDAVGPAYAFLGRRPKKDAVDELLNRLYGLKLQIEADWARRWLLDTIEIVSEKRSVGGAMPDNPAEREDLLQAVLFLAKYRDSDKKANPEIIGETGDGIGGEAEIPERVFSMRCYGNSKHFERTIRTRLARIIKKYLIRDDCNDDEALRAVGIVPYPELFLFSGALSIALPGGDIDYSALPRGGTLNIDAVKLGRVKIGSNVRRVLSVENMANYVDYVYKSQTDAELILFHGGQYSPAKKAFLQAVVMSLPADCGFYHWGDIDYGGFNMLARLRREIYPLVKPWKMGIEDLIQYGGFTAGFNELYKKKLAALLDNPELSDCYPCIEYMLNAGVRLEQEAMLT